MSIKKHKKIADKRQNLFKREWGAEKNTTPLSSQHQIPTDFAIAYSRLAIVLTIVFWLMYIISVIVRQLIDGPQDYHFTVEVVGYFPHSSI